MKKINKYASPVTLVILWFCAGMIIFARSYFSTSGWLSPDSIDYLIQAKSILNGYGFYRPDITQLDGLSFFGTWPIGYPFLIASMSFLTGLDPIWASKVLNVLGIGSLFFLFWILFKDFAVVPALIVLCLKSFITIYTHTWSETIFLPGILFFTFALYRYRNESKHLYKWAIILLLTSTFLFLLRYIGVISVIAMFILGGYLLFKKENQKALKLIMASFISIACMSAYFIFTKFNSGSIGNRNISDMTFESVGNLILMLFNALNNALILYGIEFYVLNQFAVLISIIIIGGVIIWRIWYINKHLNLNIKKHELWIYLLLMSVFYLTFLTVLRFMFGFVGIDYRLISPFTLLLLTSVTAWLYYNTSLNITGIKIYVSIIIFVLFMSFYLSPFTSFRNFPVIKIKDLNEIENFPKHLKELEQKFNKEKIPENSLVIFSDYLLYYIRQDVSIYMPKQIINYIEKKDMDDIIKNTYSTHAEHIFVYTGIIKDTSHFKFNESVIEFLEKHQDNEIIKIK